MQFQHVPGDADSTITDHTLRSMDTGRIVSYLPVHVPCTCWFIFASLLQCVLFLETYFAYAYLYI